MALLSGVINMPQAQPTEAELRELARTPLYRSPASTGGAPARATSTTTLVVDKTLATAASLAQLLPSGTVLAFQALSPSFANRGSCYTSNKFLSALLIALCTFSCVFFTFTDSVRGTDSKLYYGLATANGLFVFNYEGSNDERSKVLGDLSNYGWRFLDFVHAFFGVLLFLAVAFSDVGVQSCFFPKAGPNTKELLVNLPLGAGFLSSMVFLVFPTSRKGIGYSGTARQSTQ